MRRRALLAHAVGATVAAPLAAKAQGSAMPVIGILRSTGPIGQDDTVAAFRAGLADAGLVEGRDVAIEYRWAENRPERLPEMAAELVARRVAVIVVNSAAAPAAIAATTTIPIVFVLGVDPVRAGLVASIPRPGGNVTGVSFLDVELAAKRLGILHELVPRLATILVLVDPGFAGSATEQVSVEEAARKLGRRILALKAGSDAEIEAAFATAAAAGVQGAFVGAGPFYNSLGRVFAELTTRHRLPAVYAQRRFPEAGGLLSYGPNLADAFRRGGIYVAQVLRGAKPADLPVELASRFELVINLRTAQALGLEILQILLATADEVIE